MNDREQVARVSEVWSRIMYIQQKIGAKCGRLIVALVMVGSFVLEGEAAQVQDRATNSENQRPNVLFIAIDDLNDWVGYMGHPDAITPNLDKAASQGVWFSNAHCAVAVCNPSRVAVMTGQAAWRTGVYDNNEDWQKSVPDALTLNKIFKENGYKTHGFGKIYHSGFATFKREDWTEYPPPINGKNAPFIDKDQFPYWGVKFSYGMFDYHGFPDVPAEEFQEGQAAQYGVDFLSKPHQEPFFLALGFIRPHDPRYAPKKYFDMYDPSTVTMPEVLPNDLDDTPVTAYFPDGWAEKIKKAGKWREAVAGYLACVTFTDEMVGRVLDALERSEYKDNTIVVIWSDHGIHVGEKNYFAKKTLWERSTLSPLIVYGPGISQGECVQPASLLDIYPTLKELCNLKGNPVLDGQSLVPQLNDPTTERTQPAITTRFPYEASARDKDFRFTLYRDGTKELYDHRNDPNEFENLAGDPKYQHVEDRLKKYLPQSWAPFAPTYDGHPKSTYSLEKWIYPKWKRKGWEGYEEPVGAEWKRIFNN